MDINQVQAAIEAILFASGDPVPFSRIEEALAIDKQTLRKLIMILEERINSSHGGLRIIHLDDSYQLVTREEYAPYIRTALDSKRNMPLSQAALEALAVIAYNQPVTKTYIDEIRGVDCSGTIAHLLSKKLIEERGRLEVPGRPILYGTTLDFMRCFGLASLADLPPLQQNTEEASE